MFKLTYLDHLDLRVTDFEATRHFNDCLTSKVIDGGAASDRLPSDVGVTSLRPRDRGLSVQHSNIVAGAAVAARRHSGPVRSGGRSRNTNVAPYRAGGCPAGASLKQASVVARAQEIIGENLETNLKVQVVAKAVGCSPYHLMRMFRAETGRSLRQYRTELRIQTALVRVAAGEKNLTRLAVELGFSSHSHMTDAFRKVLGSPPSALRGCDKQTLR